MRKYEKNKRSVEYRLLKHRYKILLKSSDDANDTDFKINYIL